METSIPAHHKNVGIFIHLSTFCKYLFPFGNFIAPLIIWSAQKRDAPFIDKHGRAAINFQLSILLYLVALVILSIPILIYFAVVAGGGSENFNSFGHINDPTDFADFSAFLITLIILGIFIIGFFLIELISVISAAVKASQGELYTFPITINFIKAAEVTETESTQRDSSTFEEK